ncbi:MAG: squalene/phytoene synthase family protein [Pseudomonadota bacterium]
MDALAWCRERILVPGNPLSASLLFAEAGERDRILALRTLIGELGAAAETREGEVAETKLQWWRDALSGAQPAAQRHPVMMALSESEALDPIEGKQLDRLIDGVAELVELPRFEQFDELWGLCQRVGGRAAALEAQLLGASASIEKSLAVLGASAYLIRMTRDVAMDARNNRWWVPLELQADYQVSRKDVQDEKGGAGFDGLVRTLVHEAIKRAAVASETLNDEAAWIHRHALIFWALDRRLGLKITRSPSRLMRRRILPSHSGNVWTAWRSARRLRRGESL